MADHARSRRLVAGSTLVAALVAVALTVGVATPRHAAHFCAGGGAAGPMAATPKAAVLAYVGDSAKDWVRQDNGSFAGVRFAPKGNPCGVTVEKTDGGWRVTENAGL
ncbi:MAG TPA: hypothetical protein VHC63_05660 [Acidimicrobiales bacterium]|nr:hypothetical protein [Acidimicrobiales bacterium]